ncbi:TetR/AcrR family transcriptional regulator [Nonomuraea spiralis]|uniref:TetR/AcrR family transcriptional regulator n=1 Tax=Nonomuraea spiralis TaxID=46182 RepID=A0ABV5INX5_9ACTN|nr:MULTISPECIES: TetR/AcrR family transcriptional regulator [Nonomuraea]RSM96188.1 TetR family transcriptional regulator [Nonomuraea sp. WAC 01424]GGT26766.1 TetR family transcriptional regulator [Nonomuraea spiralis]
MRKSAAEALGTRTAILERSVAIASAEGLEGLTIGRLAFELEMSKSGVIGHFGTKEALQLAVLGRAGEIFRAEVWAPAIPAEPGLPRLRVLCEAWISYLEREVFPGGCFFVAASHEFDGRAGAVRDAVVSLFDAWRGRLRKEAGRAADAGDLPPGTDPDQLVFELLGLLMATNHAIQLHRDPMAPERARRAVRARLGG